jgi:hypothetical protein
MVHVPFAGAAIETKYMWMLLQLDESISTLGLSVLYPSSSETSKHSLLDMKRFCSWLSSLLLN